MLIQIKKLNHFQKYVLLYLLEPEQKKSNFICFLLKQIFVKKTQITNLLDFYNQYQDKTTRDSRFFILSKLRKSFEQNSVNKQIGWRSEERRVVK